MDLLKKSYLIGYGLSRSKLIIIFMVFLTLSGASFAYNLYVDSEANAAIADGTYQSPFNSIQDAIDYAFDDTLAINQISSKVVINVMPNASGYCENVTINYMGESDAHHVSDISIQSSSAVLNHCSITALDSSRPVIQVIGTQSSKLTLKGLEITHTAFNNGVFLTSKPNTFYGYLDALHIQNCIFNTNWVAIEFDSACRGFNINSFEVLNSTFILNRDSNWATSTGIETSVVNNEENTAYIIGNKFIELNPCPMSYSVSIGRDISNVEIRDNVFDNATVTTSNNFNNQNVTVSNNTFKEASLFLSNYGDWLIEGNKFVGLSSIESQSAILLHGGISSSTAICTIDKNSFYNCFLPLEITIPSSNQPQSQILISLTNNSFVNCEKILSLQRLSNMQAISNSVTSYRNNLYYGASDAPFTFIGQDGSLIELTGDNRIPISYSHFSTPLTAISSIMLDASSVSYGEPLINIDTEADTYSLQWDEIVRSPCINTGCPEVDNIPQSDPDGTPPDIGAVYYPHHHREYGFDRVNQSGIHWLCFPVLDDRSHIDGQRYNELGYLFQEHMILPNAQLESVNWSYNGVTGPMRYDIDWNYWPHTDYQASQSKGFKIRFRDGIGSVNPILVDGFKADPATTPVKLYIGENGSFENWIGYFASFTQGAGDVFSKVLPGSVHETYLDHIYCIKAQDWSTYRVTDDYNSRWIIDPNRYTLSEGDMVSILLLRNAPEEMYWHAFTQSQAPRIRALPEHFEYSEETDYIPIFIEFDPDDLPDELGLMVAGECRGAAVVDSNLIEVNYYPYNAAKSEDEIEIFFYYGNKGMKKAPSSLVYNLETMLFEAGALKASQIGEYGYVSFNRNAGSSLVPLATELMQNYPNPFRAHTNISWVLGKDEPVRIDIYNQRGQKVATLFDGMGKKGRQSISWDAKDASGKSVASGIYFYRLSASQESKIQKMIVIK